MKQEVEQVTVIGAGLAGSEASYQLAERDIRVRLHEMRPKVMTKAHKTGKAAELVCSNSFRGADLTNAVGLLKEELRLAGSLIMRAADHAKVPAGGALAVDREVFSAYVDDAIRSHPLITMLDDVITEVPSSTRRAPVIIATGPLTDRRLAASVQEIIGSTNLNFFDAISPIIEGDSLNLKKLFRQSRYQKGGGDDYLNVPLDKDQYYAFIEAVRAGEKFGGHEEVESDYVDNLRPFEGCMPIEEMIDRGPDTLMFGPMKPVGLIDPHTGKRPFAVVQLRQDDRAGTLWSMVGFQTKLRHGDQQRIFRSLPGLENAVFVRLGSVHRNTFIDSPKCLHPTLEFRTRPGLFFAGQITGVEGYVESTAGGLVAARSILTLAAGAEPSPFPGDTAMGSLMNYISEPARTDFQPMNISFGLMPSYFEQPGGKRSKDERRRKTAERALQSLGRYLSGETGQVEVPGSSSVGNG